MNTPKSPIVDAHHHFWELGRFDYSWLDAEQLEPIRKSYLPADLKPHLDATGVDKSVFVQTQHNVEENRWVLELAEQNDFITGVVGWVDLASDQCESQLEEFKDHPKFVGIRHVTQDEPDDDFIIRPEVIRGLQVLEKHSVPFDLLFFVKHLKHAKTVAQQCPDLPLVIDHLAKPEIKNGRLDNWEQNFRDAANCDNVWCKLSGMVTEADWQSWKSDDLRQYVEIALEVFGPSRLMFGSDWPVCELAGEYEAVFGVLQELLSDLSESEKSQIFGQTAIDFYKLQL